MLMNFPVSFFGGGLLPFSQLLAKLVSLRGTATRSTISPNGFADAFFDITGIDAVNSVNALYQSANQYYTGLPTTSYANPNGTGNRTATITASQSGYNAAATVVIDGTTSGQTFALSSSNNTNSFVRFQFAAKVVITKMRFYKTATTSEGSYKNQGSNDGTTWFDVSSTYVHTGSTLFESTNDLINSYPEGFLYYQKLGVGGAAAAQGNQAEYEFEISTTSGMQNIDLRSVAYTAAAAPSQANVVILYAAVDTSTLNTDFIGYFSRDGSTYTAATLTNQGASGIAGYNYLTGTVDLSAQPTGTSMKVRSVTANNKRQKIAGFAGSWA